MRPASRCGAGEFNDWSASGSIGWRDYACASPFWETGRRSSSRSRAVDGGGGERGCEKDITKRVCCPCGFLDIRVCEEGGAVGLDSEGEDGCSGRGDGVESTGYCQCRCGGLRLRCLAFIVGNRGDGGEEREEEEEDRGSGESVEAHLMILTIGTFAEFFLSSSSSPSPSCSPFLCRTIKICGV